MVSNYNEIEPRYPSGWVFSASLIATVAMLAGLFMGTLVTFFDAVVIAMLGLFAVVAIAMRMARPSDADWLPAMVAVGYIAKIGYSLIRYLVLEVIYHGSGDAVGYHGAGGRLVEYWRSFQVPPGMGTGTTFVDGLTGLIYVPYVPSMLGGFFIFATLAFLGQLLMYAAFRLSTKERRLKWYTYPLFFLPAITYWPSSIGKESLMFLGLGLSAYGAALFLNRGGIKSLFVLGAGLGLSGAIRPHMAALVIAAFAATLVLAKSKKGVGMGMSPFVRWTAVLVVGAGCFLLISFAASEFNIDLQSANIGAEVDEFVGNLEDNTAKGGSEVSGGAVSNPVDLPEATLRVLFRPLPYEAHNMTAMASALESSLLLLIIVWRSPKILKNLRWIREDAYVLMSAIMTLGFVIIFSPFLNLGLLARERSQVLPFLAVVVVQLGWDRIKKEEPTAGPGPGRQPASMSA